jgi:transposase InsO family protein
MPRRRALTGVLLDELFALPTEKNTLVRYWILDHTDLEAINQRRRNPNRLHSALGYRSPMAYEHAMEVQPTEA